MVIALGADQYTAILLIYLILPDEGYERYRTEVCSHVPGEDRQHLRAVISS